MWVFCSAGWGNQHTHPVSVALFWSSDCRQRCLLKNTTVKQRSSPSSLHVFSECERCINNIGVFICFVEALQTPSLASSLACQLRGTEVEEVLAVIHGGWNNSPYHNTWSTISLLLEYAPQAKKGKISERMWWRHKICSCWCVFQLIKITLKAVGTMKKCARPHSK